ncbi:tRNA (N6-threonylcarbamoyladenosine(37)-N6)-methyltransferase TrmO [Enterococcus sp. LJL128]
MGIVDNQISQRKDNSWGTDLSKVILKSNYFGGLKDLSEFSHVLILYYLNQAHFDEKNHLQRKPQNREDMPLVGIFSQRGKDRPNQIGITAVEVVSVSETTLTVKGLDAIDGTPVLDIKPYYPMYDCKDEAIVPEWVNRLMKSYF